MNNNVIVNLDTKEIAKLIEKLESMNESLQKAPLTFVDKVAKNGLTHLDMLYATSIKYDNIGNINTYVETTQTGSQIIAEGEDVAYYEYGTGDEGLLNKHPEKDDLLNDYNSGQHIRPMSMLRNKIERLKSDSSSLAHGQELEDKINSSNLKNNYWTYKQNGEIVYTSGIPAGKQVFDTRNYILNEGINKVAKEIVGDVVSKL